MKFSKRFFLIPIKLYYLTNNAYNSLLVLFPDRADFYTADGSEDFPIIDTQYIEVDHPEYQTFVGSDARRIRGSSGMDAPALEAAAMDYLKRIAPYADNFDGADTTLDREEDESEQDFVNRLLEGNDILAEYEINREE